MPRIAPYRALSSSQLVPPVKQKIIPHISQRLTLPDFKNKPGLYNTGDAKAPMEYKVSNRIVDKKMLFEYNLMKMTAGGVDRIQDPSTLPIEPFKAPKQKWSLLDPHLLYRSKCIQHSTKKLLLLTRLIAHLTVPEAMVQLRLSNKKVAPDLITFLEEAREEAIKTRGLDRESLFVDECWVCKAFQFKYAHGRRRRVSPNTRKYSRVYVLLKDRDTIIRRQIAKDRKDSQRKLKRKINSISLRNTPLADKRNFMTC